MLIDLTRSSGSAVPVEPSSDAPRLDSAGTLRARTGSEIEGIQRAVNDNHPIVLPTDTVYGIGGNPHSTVAVNAVLAAKGRGRHMPPPVLVASIDDAVALTDTVSDDAGKLMERFWPGALTLILTRHRNLDMDLGDILDTVAMRMPDHPVTLDVLEHCGPLAVTSANRTGQPPATVIDEARRAFGDSVAVYIDAGSTPGSVPSTILDMSGDEPRLVRAGVLGVEDLQRCCRATIRHHDDEPTRASEA